ncbi:MAG: AAA family ATPase [Candidatus Nanopelagicales bacterium]
MRWVEDQARALVDDGQAPPEHWPAEVLHAVHQARQEHRAGQGQKEAPAGTSLGFVDWGRFWTEDAPEVEYLIPGLLLKGTACAIHSKAGAGKSLLSLELAVNLATGGVALGEPVDAGTVLYVDLEQDRGLVRERLESLGLDGSADLSRLHYSLLGGLAAAGHRQRRATVAGHGGSTRGRPRGDRHARAG